MEGCLAETGNHELEAVAPGKTVVPLIDPQSSTF